MAELVTTPRGRAGRPSKALTLAQANAVLEEAESSPLHAYVVLSLMVGIRTEEARALQWAHVIAWDEAKERFRSVSEAGFDHDRFALYVWQDNGLVFCTRTGTALGTCGAASG